MSNSEAIHNLYGEISTERDGDLTHQCIQTNLADVICGGNPNDKILYPRSSKRRSASFPTPRSLERRHSLRLFGSSKRLQRCQSTKSLSKNTTLQPNQSNTITDSSSSECHSTDSSSPSECYQVAIFFFHYLLCNSTEKSASLLSRIFRRSCRTSKKIESFSAQFPPREWFNSKAVHLQSVGTQTLDHHVSFICKIYIVSNISWRKKFKKLNFRLPNILIKASYFIQTSKLIIIILHPSGFFISYPLILRRLWTFATFLDTTASTSSQSFERIDVSDVVTWLLANPPTITCNLLWRQFASFNSLDSWKITKADAS